MWHIKVGISLFVLTAVFLWPYGCGRGPERRLRGVWVLDRETTIEQRRKRMDELADKDEDWHGSAAHALSEALLAAAQMREREYTFNADGTVRVVVRADRNAVPGIGGDVTLAQERGEWKITEVGEETLTVRITGGEQYFDGWERVLHFDGDDRVFYYRHDPESRIYWGRTGRPLPTRFSCVSYPVGRE